MILGIGGFQLEELMKHIGIPMLGYRPKMLPIVLQW